MPDYPDFFGTPLVHGVNFLAGPNATLAVPANTKKTITLLCSHPGYFIDIFATIASGSATAPFYLVEFIWQDSGGLAIIDIEHFYLAASSTGPWRTCGKGPNRGQLLTVNITNLDPAFAITVNYSIGETTQHIARDDWRTVDYQTANVPQYGTFENFPSGLAKGDMAAGLLMTETNDTIGAHVQWQFLLPMYTGFVLWQLMANTAIAVSIRTPAELSVTSNVDGGAPIWVDLTLTDVTVQLAHPRLPLVIFLQNTTAAAIAGVSAMAVMIENAS